MLFFVIFLIAIEYSSAHSLDYFATEHLLPPVCGVDPVNIAHLPWMAGVEILDEDNEHSIICGGSLINGRYILTSAHCIEDEEPVSVILGTSNANHNGTRIEIENTISDDLALIKLAKRVEFDEYIQPICLPFSIEDYDPPSNDTEFYIAGWGNQNNTLNNDILVIDKIPFVPLDDCDDLLEQELTDYNICAGGEEDDDDGDDDDNDDDGYCFNDEGSHLMRQIGKQWTLEGIITKIPEDECDSMTIGVFTNVLKYERWIEDHILHGWETNENGADKESSEEINAELSGDTQTESTEDIQRESSEDTQAESSEDTHTEDTESSEEKDTLSLENDASEKTSSMVIDSKLLFIVAVIILIAIALILCLFLTIKYWKTHSTCIIASSIIILCLLVATYVTSYFI